MPYLHFIWEKLHTKVCQIKRKKWALLSCILFEGYWETVADKKFKKMEKNCHFVYMNPINIHKITFERWSNSNSDITFRMHNKDKICKIIQYLKNEKTEN